MSFKRTSCALQTMSNSELNTCDVVCLGPPNSEEENAQHSDTRDDIPVATFHPCFSLETTDEQFASLVCSSTPQSPSNESSVVSVQEVGPLQKLVARDAGCFALEKSKTFQDKQMLVCRESGSTNLDLRSERHFETGIDNELEEVKKNVPDDCGRCYELQRISEAKDSKITELAKKLNELTEKHKMFIVSNCVLNEENDCLKIRNQRLELQLGEVTFENSQLRSEKDNLLKQFATRGNQRLEKRRVSSSSSCLRNAEHSHPDTSDHCETFSTVIRDDLQEAIMLSCQQKSDVRDLQEKITHQNELIKMLCSQLQKMKGLGKPSSLNLHCQGASIAGIPQQEKSPSVLQRQMSNKFSAVLSRPDDVPYEGIDEDNGILLARNISHDEDLYSRGVTCPAPFISTKTQQTPCVVTSNTTFQSQGRDAEKQKSQEQQLGQSMGCNIQESSRNWHPNNANVDVGNTMAQMPCIQKQLLHSEIVACPFCGHEFLGSSADFPHKFEIHMATCTGLGERQCPMCLKTLPGLSQADFERHVNDHFVPEFEVLVP